MLKKGFFIHAPVNESLAGSFRLGLLALVASVDKVDPAGVQVLLEGIVGSHTWWAYLCTRKKV